MTDKPPVDVFQRQTVAGVVYNGKLQPELTPEERQQIVGTTKEIDHNTAAALTRQSKAGVGGEPELSPEERDLIVKHNA
ncbi:hypothetical protein ISR94_00125 [Candidatus Microgenomates bacterium]|nr:hypothetical protein [Candidatus Microgenomates bacterium]